MTLGFTQTSGNETAGLAGLKLPFRFDRARLQRDIELVAPDEWSDHYNERDFGGQWQGAALRSASGSVLDTGAGPPGNGHFADTPLLARCSYFREVLGEFLCPLKSVRLLSLAPRSFIREHSDHALGFEDGEVRIHIPLRTSPGVEFYVCGERLLLEEGECYYINVNLPHRVNNRGPEARIHLVIDAEVNDWVRNLFEGCSGHNGKIPRSPLPPGGFEEFADVVFSDAVLRDNLRAIPDRSDLLRSIASEAAARGFDLTEADIEAAFRARSSTSLHGTGGWTPIEVAFRESGPRARWIYAPEARFTEPYFEDSVRLCLQNPFTSLFQREMPLTAGARVRPDGFIFHMSRCGSTLVSRSLAAAESTLVIAEAPPADQIVRADGPDRALWLEWMVAALGDRRTGAQTRYLIKLDAWHIRSLPLFREVFPGVPWIFLYRDPREVLVSLLNQPGLHACPGLMDPAIFGLREEDRTLPRQQWCVRVLESFLTAALAFREDPKCLFVDYTELPGAICGRIAKHFGLHLTAGEEARVEDAAQFDAKNPWAQFAGDTETKQLQARSFEPDPGLATIESLYLRLGNQAYPYPSTDSSRRF